VRGKKSGAGEGWFAPVDQPGVRVSAKLSRNRADITVANERAKLRDQKTGGERKVEREGKTRIFSSRSGGEREGKNDQRREMHTVEGDYETCVCAARKRSKKRAVARLNLRISRCDPSLELLRWVKVLGPTLVHHL